MGKVLRFEPGDVTAGERPEKVADALARFVAEVVEEAEAFDEGYRLLDAQFGPINELERREVLDRWFERGTLSAPDAPLEARYAMVLFRDRDGRVAAVRDCFTALDRATGRVVVLMSHSLVLPEWRRSGLGALVRASPVGLARRHGALHGVERPEILLVSEMEPIDPDDPKTLVRLAAYTRSGMRVVPPWVVPYGQPDFRDTVALGIRPVPLPFLLLVRQVGEEDAPAIAWDRVVALCDAFGAIHGPSVDPAQRPEIVAAMLRHHEPGGAVPLLAPDTRRFEDVAPLLASAIRPHYPSGWTAGWRPRDLDADRNALSLALRSLS